MRAEQLPLIRTWQLERDCAVAKARTELKECVLDEYLDRFYKEHETFMEEQDKIDAEQDKELARILKEGERAEEKRKREEEKKRKEEAERAAQEGEVAAPAIQDLRYDHRFRYAVLRPLACRATGCWEDERPPLHDCRGLKKGRFNYRP